MTKIQDSRNKLRHYNPVRIKVNIKGKNIKTKRSG